MIYKRDNSPHWIIEFTFRGQRYRKASGTSSKLKAEAIERKWRQELEDLELLGKPREMTLGEALNQQFKLLAYIKADPDQVELRPGFSRDVRQIGHFGTGDLELTLRNRHDLDRAKPLLDLSYELS